MKTTLIVKSVPVLFLTVTTLLSAAPRLALSTNKLSTVNVATGANGSVQTVQAYNIGDGTLNPSVTTSASWLTASVGPEIGLVTSPAAVAFPSPLASIHPPSWEASTPNTSPSAIRTQSILPQDIAVTVNTTGVPGSINAYVAPYGSSELHRHISGVYQRKRRSDFRRHTIGRQLAAVSEWNGNRELPVPLCD